jgi:hypothetical protein
MANAEKAVILCSALFDAAHFRKVPTRPKIQGLLEVFGPADYAETRMRKLPHTIAALLAIVFVAPSVPAETFTHITAENGVAVYDIQKDAGSGVYTEPSSNHQFKLTYKQGQRDTAEPVFVAKLKTTRAEHFRGGEALQLEIVARDEIDTVKAAYKVSVDSVGAHDRFTPRVAEPKNWYHGFAMKIDLENFSLPNTGDVLFEQWWQGTPFHPPVALVIVGPQEAKARGWIDSSRFGNFALVLRDDEHNALNSTPGEALYFNLGPASANEWLRWIVHVRPSPIEENGAVTVWLNDEQKLKLENVKVGFNPNNPVYDDRKPSNRLASVNVCLYRMNGQNFQRVFFDEVKFANQQADAAP